MLTFAPKLQESGYWFIELLKYSLILGSSLNKWMACLKICLSTYFYLLITMKQYLPYVLCSTLGVKACVKAYQTSNFPAYTM